MQIPERPATDCVAEFVASQPFALDEFQVEAIGHLAAGRSVLVSAPTGSGKTVIAEYAVHAALASGSRCVYTTPLKALSNQKYRDLKAQLGDQVGLMTGDVVIDPDAPILIMTTEILRNILQADPDRVADVSHVILDEAHYIAAEGRGTVWEETIVFLGKATLVVALSATISNADELAAWVSSVHRPMAVVFHAERPVPLEAYVALPGITRLFDDKGRLALRAFRGNAEERRPRTFSGGRNFAREGWIDAPDPVSVVRGLRLKRMLPAIYFVFSRQGCEDHTRDLVQADLELTTKDEAMEIQAAIDQAIQQTPGLMGSIASRRWMEFLPEGVAPHHAGLLPPLKLLIEKLFQRGLIKVVFATETLSAGINMPARTVVLSNLVKRSDDGMRMLTVGEFHQMTGRAGRRGMDEVGYGVVLASHRYAPQDVVRLVRGAVEPLRSRFTLNYNMVVNLTHRYEPRTARRIVEQSFASFQNDALIAHLYEQRDRLSEQISRFDPTCPVTRAEPAAPAASSGGSAASDAGKAETRDVLRADWLDRFEILAGRWESVRKRLAALEAQRRYLSRNVATDLLARAPIGSWLLIHAPGRPRPELAVLLAKQETRGGDVHFSVLTSLPAMLRLGTQHLVTVPEGRPVAALPAHVLAKARSLSYLQHKRPDGLEFDFDLQVQKSGVDLADIEWAMAESPDLVKLRAKLGQLNADLARLPCGTCAAQRECKDRVAERRLLDQEIAQVHEHIESVRSSHWREFKALIQVLVEARYLRERELLARGIALANIRTTNELMAAECVAGGFLEGKSPTEMAAIVSCLVAEPPRGRQAWYALPFGAAVHEVVRGLGRIGRDLFHLQTRHRVDLPIYLVTEYAGLTQAWAEGATWSELITRSGIDEGQLVRHLRQVIDMLSQFREIPGVSAGFHARAREAAALLDRDIVKEVF